MEMKSKYMVLKADEIVETLAGAPGYVTIPFLMAQENMTDPEVRATVSLLVRQGYPIVSRLGGAGGYKLTYNTDEISNEIRVLSSRRRKLSQRIRALRHAAA